MILKTISISAHQKINQSKYTMQLDFPKYQFNIKKKNEKLYIFDKLRKKNVRLTPEEWVRQNVIRFLSQEKKYPESLIATEISLTLNKQKKRADIVIYAIDRSVKMIVECKAPSVEITQNSFEQAARYNMQFGAKYLLVTNGVKHFCCLFDFETDNYIFLNDIPEYSITEK